MEDLANDKAFRRDSKQFSDTLSPKAMLLARIVHAYLAGRDAGAPGLVHLP